MNDVNDARLKEAFLLMDEQQNGFITTNDLRFLIRALGFTPTQYELDKYDAEFIHSKNIDYSWFVTIMSVISFTQYKYEQIEQAFRSFDKKHYGLINIETFKKAIMTLGEPLSETEMNEMIKDLPIDEDGFIEYEHYCLQFKAKSTSLIFRNTIEEKQ